MLPTVVEQTTDMEAMDDDVTWWTLVAIAVAALLQIYNIVACARTTAAWVCPRREHHRDEENTTRHQPTTTSPPLATTENRTSEMETEGAEPRSPVREPASGATMQARDRVRLARREPEWQIMKRNACAGVLSAMIRWRLLAIRTIQDAEHTINDTEYIQREGAQKYAQTHKCLTTKQCLL